MSPSIVTVGQVLSPEDRAEGEAPITDSAGVPHYYIDPDEPSLRQRAQWRAWSAQLDKLENVTVPTEAQEAQYHALQVEMCAYALPTIDREELAGLKAGERTGLLLAFLIHNGMTGAAGRAIRQLRASGVLPSAGTPLSPGSNGSTA